MLVSYNKLVRVMRIINLINKAILKLLGRIKGGVFYARKVGVVIGEGCRIYITDFGSEPFLISIGDKVTITSGVKLLTHDGSTWLISNSNGRRYQRYGKICIGNNVFIGVNSIVLPGVEIGNEVIVAAGSVVTSDVPPNSVVGGNPAKVLMSFDAYRDKVMELYVNDEELDGFMDYRDRCLGAIRLAQARK